MPYDKSPMKKSSCIKMYDGKGKQTGLMMEGSVAHMESVMQEKKNLMQDMPIDNRGVGEMSPYKMDHGSAAHHSGKSKLHVKPEKDYPDDGHLHYQGGKKVESPGASETKKLSDTSGGVGQMSPYKFTGMSGGSAFHAHGPGGTHPDPPTTTLSNALASDADYQEVPGYEERLGGELGEVVVTANKKKPKKEKKGPGRHSYTHAGKALRWAGTFLSGDRYKRRQIESGTSKNLFIRDPRNIRSLKSKR